MSRSAISVVLARSRRSGHPWRNAAYLNPAVKDEAEELRIVVDPSSARSGFLWMACRERSA